MSVLCVIGGLLQLVILVTLTGILVSVAAVSRLMELTITLVHPTCVFFLRQSGKLVVLEVVLADLGAKFPCLRYILRPEYAPYLNTAGTVLLGWLIVCWLFHIIWILLAPLTATAIAIILICPATAKWCLGQVANLEGTFRDFYERFQTNLSQTHWQYVK